MKIKPNDTHIPTNQRTNPNVRSSSTWMKILIKYTMPSIFPRILHPFQASALYCVSSPLGRRTSKRLLLDRSSVKKSTSLQSVDRSIARHALSESAWAMGLLELWSSYGPGISGAVFGSGWWFWVDAVVCSAIKVPFLHYLPGSHLYLPPPPPSLSLSLSPPKSFISCSILSIFLFKLHHFAWRGIETLHGAFAVGLELCSFGYVPADRKNVSRWVNGGNLTTGHPHDMIKA